ncbi:MAG TPA: prepilin-type N-terminal cleavage/methylation domain-containing protein [Burkholderiales bacterium]|nr:prepilin-type N-terminal cleavage/methylation domain-containing protein [Burkholderiales bacterium]
MAARRRQSGFTLVEVAIVLVIIGLLLGGILKGQELIAQAKVKGAIADFSGISAAYHGYQDRYRAIPGDDLGATRWTGATPGNGDGILGGTYNASAGSGESRLWWDHLRRAGFIVGAGQRQPFNAVSGIIGVQTGDAAGGSTLGGLSQLMACSTSLPDKIALAVDVQMDDGDGATGSVRALAQSSPSPAVDGTSVPAAYAETGTNVYTVCRQMP